MIFKLIYVKTFDLWNNLSNSMIIPGYFLNNLLTLRLNAKLILLHDGKITMISWHMYKQYQTFLVK